MDDSEARSRLRAGFDDAAELYDRTRPVCPESVFEDLVNLAKLPQGASLVEIGCGTGQATLPLAQRGFRILGIELGPRLAAFTRLKLAAYPNVDIINASFEDWDPSGVQFDGVIAFHAFHWIDPALRYVKTAQVLREKGILAVVASKYVVPDDADRFWTEVQEDYAAVDSTLDQEPPRPDTVRDLSDEIAASGTFENIAVRRYLWQVNFTADEYISLLSTSSWHRALAEEARQTLFGRIRRRTEMLPGARVTPTILTTLNLAHRL